MIGDSFHNAAAARKADTTAPTDFPGILATPRRYALPMPGNGMTRRRVALSSEGEELLLRRSETLGRIGAEGAFLAFAIDPPSVEHREDPLNAACERAVSAALEAFHGLYSRCGPLYDDEIASRVRNSFRSRWAELAISSSPGGTA